MIRPTFPDAPLTAEQHTLHVPRLAERTEQNTRFPGGIKVRYVGKRLDLRDGDACPKCGAVGLWMIDETADETTTTLYAIEWLFCPACEWEDDDA